MKLVVANGKVLQSGLRTVPYFFMLLLNYKFWRFSPVYHICLQLLKLSNKIKLS